QVVELTNELVRRNPSFNRPVTSTLEKGTITGLGINTDEVRDLTPLRALPDLVRLDCVGTAPGKGRLVDLLPLEGLRLTFLSINFNKVADLAPISKLPLTQFHCDYNPITDLTALQGMVLSGLSCKGTKVKDLTPLAQARLKTFRCGLTAIGDLSILKS